MNILVSACLFGVNCKHTGGNNYSEKVHKLKDDYTLILVCPEQLGGLSTPRPAAEIQQNTENGELKVLTVDGDDVTEEFIRGAEMTLKVAQLHECKLAILKENSPSCGSTKIYDGTFSGKLIDGSGVAAKLLMDHGIKVISEHDDFSIIDEIMKGKK